MSAPTLDQTARWDIPLLRSAVSSLDAVAGALLGWRARMEAVGRSLDDAECWYGPAAQAAGTALVDVSVVTTAVTTALNESLESAQRLLGEAETAQELAERALAAAAAVPVVLDGAGRLVGPLPVQSGPGTLMLDADQTAAVLRAQELAEEALAAASLAGRAASEAADALSALGVGRRSAPADFVDLAASVPHSSPSSPVLQLGASRTEVAQWWAGLSTAARAEAIARAPYLVGGLDGLPAWARDEANRLHLEHVLADPSSPGHEVALSVAREIATRTAEGDEVQLYQFQPAEELVALATGDVDTADSVAVVVPGIRNTVREDLDELGNVAATVADATVAAAPAATVATIAWFGYRPPGLLGGISSAAADRGGAALDRTLNGLAAARSADRPRVTVVAHSYGTVVTGRAVAAPGHIAANALVLNGSPGLDLPVEQLEADEVYEATSASDYVTWLELHGRQTWDSDFGTSSRLPTEWDMGHAGYYDPEHPTVGAIREVVAGIHDRR